jgi:hypothetical protein
MKYQHFSTALRALSARSASACQHNAFGALSACQQGAAHAKAEVLTSRLAKPGDVLKC